MEITRKLDNQRIDNHPPTSPIDADNHVDSVSVAGLPRVPKIGNHGRLSEISKEFHRIRFGRRAPDRIADGFLV